MIANLIDLKNHSAIVYLTYIMHIKLSQLKKMISEVAISPSLKNNPLQTSPLNIKSVKQGIEGMKRDFENALKRNLIIASMEKHYDVDSREFDDSAYEQIDVVAKETTEKMVKAVSQTLIDVWRSAHKSDRPSMTPPAKGKAA